MAASSLEGFRRLLRIQELDAELAVAEAALAELPGERAAIAAAIEAAEQDVLSTRQRLEQEERDERHLEVDLRAQEALIERLNGQGAQVTSTQAYTALQHEIEHAAEARSGFETRALELMEAIDGGRNRLVQAQAQHAALAAKAPGQLEAIDAREAELDTRRRELLAARVTECAGTEAPLVALYERVASRHRPAVLVLKGTSCPSCGFLVPAQRALDIQSGENPYRCGGCQRMLVASRVLTEAPASG